MTSYLYEGWVRHRRFAPTQHRFRYRVCLFYLDLERLDCAAANHWQFAVDRPALISFRRADHFGDPARPLHVAVRDRVEKQTGRRPIGPIRLLTHPRYLGYVMNPVSFYYCFAPDGETLETIVAEVENTPWGERHLYVLDQAHNLGNQTTKKFRFGKAFHVSPFMPMEVEYDWRFVSPGQRLAVHMVNRSQDGAFFDATMVLRRRPLNTASLYRAMLRYPFMTGKVIAAIYWQALRLRLKGTPFFDHPKHRTADSDSVAKTT